MSYSVELQSDGKMLAETLHNYGFMVLKNHDIDRELINDVYCAWRNFFNLEARKNMIFLKTIISQDSIK